MPNLLTRRAAAALVAFAALPQARSADEAFPSRTVRIILPLAPGSATDVLFRVLADTLARQLGQPVIVDNRPGADGALAVQGLMGAPADGHTLMMLGLQAVVFAPMLRRDLSYKPSDFRPLAGVARGWMALAVGAQSPFKSYEEFAAAARRTPGSLSMGNYSLSYRVGSGLLGETIGGDFRHVAYKAVGQVLTDLAGGVLDAALVDASAAIPLAQAGKLRILAAATPERLAQIPQVPTMRERGTDFTFSLWTSLSVRTGTPDVIAKRLEAEALKALATTEMRAAVAKLGTVDPYFIGADALAEEIARDSRRYAGVLKGVAAELEAEKR